MEKKKTNTTERIIEQTKKNPIIGFLYACIIVVSVLAGTISYLYVTQQNEYKKDKEANKIERDNLRTGLYALQDSMAAKDERHRAEVVQIVNAYNNDLKQRSEKQEALNQKLQDMLIKKK